MKKIAVMISGSGSNLEAIVKACHEKNIYGEIVYVISNNPDAYGIERAKKYNIPVKIIDHKSFTDRDDFDDALKEFLDNLEIDFIILAGFMRILGKNITEKFYGKMINLHPSLLPLYPGLNTHTQALNNKDDYHGISIHFVSAELDAGPLIAQGKIPVKADDDLEKLVSKIHKVEHDLLPKVINELCMNNIYLNCETNKVMYSDNLDSKMYVTYFND
ncbi:MAG: phosphoribosylglycinamide formyltransferase [Flavobacteriaceae bacterium]|nr:phosphoribosylglycinamide formyltransferase [Flavobacteriaceae bacterium]